MANRFPPGPNDGFFGLRTMSWMKRDVLAAYTELHQKYGDHVSYQTGPFRLFLFFHPEQVHDVLVTQSKSTVRLPRVMETFSQWNGRSILVTEGDEWIRNRRMVQQGFQPRRFENYGRVMSSCARRLADSWNTQAAPGGHVDVDIRSTITSLTLEIIGKTMFDVDLTTNFSEISKAVAILSEVAFHEMQAPFRLPNWWPTEFYRKKRWAMKTLDDTIWRVVRERRAEGTDHGDLLSMLLASADEGDGKRFDDKQVRDEALTLMLAGHDTSSAGLEWLCYVLARYPEIANRCRDEVRAVCDDREPAFADVTKLSYLQATIKETLRLYPPAFTVFLRQTTKPIKVADFDIPKDSLIGFSSYVTQRDPRWFADPTQFRPERFLAPDVDKIPSGAYLPFGLGPRICIGQAFALTEMTLIAATLLQQGKLTMPPGAADPTPHVFISLRPAKPLILRWTKSKS